MSRNVIPIIIDFTKTITLYGSYYPERIRIRLENLREYLKEKGWNNTNLVSDYPDDHFDFVFTSDEDMNNLNRSRYCIGHSDLNILIYIFNGTHSGVQFELDFIINQNITNYLLFVEEKESEGRKILVWSTLISAHLREIGKRFITFPENDDTYLCDIAYQRIIDYFL